MSAPAGWKYNVGGFIAAHPGWSISADSIWYFAQRRTERGPRGPKLKGKTLDELAAAVDAAESQLPS